MPNLATLIGELAWPVAVAVAWVTGELGHRLTSLPRISLYGLVRFGLGNAQLGLLPPADSISSRQGINKPRPGEDGFDAIGVHLEVSER